MNKSKILFLLIFSGFIATMSCNKDDDDGGSTGLDCNTVKYSTSILPILESSCNISPCHDANSPNGDFTDYAGLETLAKDGTMKQLVLVDKTMPKSGDALTMTQLEKIECWINAGAPDN